MSLPSKSSPTDFVDIKLELSHNKVVLSISRHPYCQRPKFLQKHFSKTRQQPFLIDVKILHITSILMVYIGVRKTHQKSVSSSIYSDHVTDLQELINAVPRRTENYNFTRLKTMVEKSLQF